MVEDELEALFNQRPMFFIEQLGAKQQQEKAATVDNAKVANSTRYQDLDVDDPRRELQDEIARKLTGHMQFAPEFYIEHYPNNRKKSYSYRQPFACVEIIEHFIRQQFRSPLTLLGKLTRHCFTLENFPLAWGLIHALTSKTEFVIEHCFLAHARDVPRDVIIRENPAYVQFATHIQRYMDNIPEDVHRLFVICHSPDMVSASNKQRLMLTIDVREGLNVCGLVNMNITDPDRFPAISLHAELESLEHRVPLRSHASLLGVTPVRLYEVWMQHSKRAFRMRQRALKRIDKAVADYSKMAQRNDPANMNIDARLYELWHLHQLCVMVAHWLYQRQHTSDHANSMWEMRKWLRYRLHRCGNDFLNTTYHNDAILKKTSFKQLSKAVYADMMSCTVT